MHHLAHIRWALWIGLAVLLTGAAVAVLIPGGTEVTGQTPEKRIAEICRLADERPAGAGEAIAAAAGDADPAVRRTAMAALGKFEAAAHRGVIEAGTQDADPGVRSAAAVTLGRLADDAAVARLGELLADEADEHVRAAAVAGLARSGRTKAIVLLVKAAETDASAKVKREAMVALTRRFGIRFHAPPTPDNDEAWEQALDRIRKIPGVRKAHGGVSFGNAPE